MTATDFAIGFGAVCSGVAVLTTAYISWRTSKHTRELAEMKATTEVILKDVNNNTAKATAEIKSLNVKITEMTKVSADKEAAIVASDLRVALATVPPPPGTIPPPYEDMKLVDDGLDVAPEKPKRKR